MKTQSQPMKLTKEQVQERIERFQKRRMKKHKVI